MNVVCRKIPNDALQNFNVPCHSLNYSETPTFNGKDYVIYAKNNLEFAIKMVKRQVASVDIISYAKTSGYTLSIFNSNNKYSHNLEPRSYNSVENNYIFNKGINYLSLKYKCDNAENGECDQIEYYKIHISSVGVLPSVDLSSLYLSITLVLVLSFFLYYFFRLGNKNSKKNPT